MCAFKDLILIKTASVVTQSPDLIQVSRPTAVVRPWGLPKMKDML